MSLIPLLLGLPCPFTWEFHMGVPGYVSGIIGAPQSNNIIFAPWKIKHKWCRREGWQIYKETVEVPGGLNPSPPAMLCPGRSLPRSAASAPPNVIRCRRSLSSECMQTQWGQRTWNEMVYHLQISPEVCLSIPPLSWAWLGKILFRPYLRIPKP